MMLLHCLLVLVISFVFHKTNGAPNLYLSTLTPYIPPLTTLVLPSPPTGFEQVCTQTVIRHGCTTLLSRRFDIAMMKLWKKAKEADELTEQGQQFGEDLRYFSAVMDKLEVGHLSGLGKLEQQGLAQRLTERLLPLFMKNLLNNSTNSIKVVSAGEPRAVESLNAFVEGLPSIITPLIDFEPENDTLLYFHAHNTNYNNYITKDKQLKEKIQSIRMQPYSKQMARNILERLFQKSFVDKLANGYYSIVDDALRISIKNEMDAIYMFYELYITSSNLREEGVGSLLDKYVHKKEAAWFGYTFDANGYYTQGPGFSGRRVTYDMAQVLLDDVFLASEQCSQIDSTYFLRACFTHGRDYLPFTNLVAIPILCDKQTPANDTYTYENNGWRGAIVSPMSANIQWDIYRHYNYGKIRSFRQQQILVRMLLNERPVSFKRDCKPYNTEDDLFYTLDELKRCYNITNH